MGCFSLCFLVELPPEGKACNGADFVELPPKSTAKDNYHQNLKSHNDLDADFVELPPERFTLGDETQQFIRNARRCKENKVKYCTIIYLISSKSTPLLTTLL